MRLHDVSWEPSDEEIQAINAEIGADVRAQSRALRKQLRLQVNLELAAARRRNRGGLELHPHIDRESKGEGLRPPAP